MAEVKFKRQYVIIGFKERSQINHIVRNKGKNSWKPVAFSLRVFFRKVKVQKRFFTFPAINYIIILGCENQGQFCARRTRNGRPNIFLLGINWLGLCFHWILLEVCGRHWISSAQPHSLVHRGDRRSRDGVCRGHGARVVALAVRKGFSGESLVDVSPLSIPSLSVHCVGMGMNLHKKMHWQKSNRGRSGLS